MCDMWKTIGDVPPLFLSQWTKGRRFVIKDDNGDWILKDEENLKCIICGDETKNNNLFCKNCYQKVKDERNNFDHNRKPGYIYEHYFNLRKSLSESKSLNEFQEKGILMWALAEEYQNIYNFNNLIDRAKLDILKELNKFNCNYKEKSKADVSPNFNEDFRINGQETSM